VHEQLLCCQIARLAPVEDRLGDIGGEIAEADNPGEIGSTDTFLLGKRSKGHSVAVGERRVELARPDLSSKSAVL
jgi:hypothetical protein